ncbi:MAG: hypothetical protein JWP37_3436, partial [Mucilaginibacter sp.]|nr:hypothetical protein [Mucilaginibacter sp.]
TILLSPDWGLNVPKKFPTAVPMKNPAMAEAKASN